MGHHPSWAQHPLAPAAQAAVDGKTKPVGALGQLEALAVQLACLQQTLQPVLETGCVQVYVADHGVAAEGVSAYPAVVTQQMLRNFAAGGAAICVFARASQLQLDVIDVGVAGDVTQIDGIVHAKVRRGTRNLRHEPAMTLAECDAALAVGRQRVAAAHATGAHAILLGEMGIGNTTAAAALTAAFTGAPPARVTGRGTGLDDAGVERKRQVVTEALARHHAALHDPRATLAALGGLELAAMCGAALEAADRGLVVIVDGFIAAAAMLAAVRLAPAARAAMVFSHRGAEPGHVVALEALAARPLLQLDLRLGEGTGAALAWPLVRASARMLAEMATFESAGVSRTA